MFETNGKEPWSYKLAWVSTAIGFIFLFMNLFTKTDLLKETLVLIGFGIILWTFHWLRWTKEGNKFWKGWQKPVVKKNPYLPSQQSQTVTRAKRALISKETQSKIQISFDKMLKKLPLMPTAAVIMTVFLVLTAYSQGNWLQLLMVVAGCAVYGLYHFNKMGEAMRLLKKHWKETWLGTSVLGLTLSFTLGYPWGGFLLSSILSAVTVFDGWSKVGEGIMKAFNMAPLLFSGIFLFGFAITKNYHGLLSDEAFLAVGVGGFLLIIAGIIYPIAKSVNSKK